MVIRFGTRETIIYGIIVGIIVSISVGIIFGISVLVGRNSQLHF